MGDTTLGDVPYPHRAVGAHGDEVLAAGNERRPDERSLVSLADSQALPARDVPEMDGAGRCRACFRTIRGKNLPSGIEHQPRLSLGELGDDAQLLLLVDGPFPNDWRPLTRHSQ